MFESYKIKQCYINSINTVNLYNELTNYLLRDVTDDSFSSLIFRLKTSIDKECICYDKLTLSELIEFESQINLSENNNLSEYIMRIKNKLMFSFEKVYNNSIMNKDLFLNLDYNLHLSILDLINSKINIDTQKLITKKISSLTADNFDTSNYILLLKDINKVYSINYLNLYEVSERMLINSSFDINKLSTYSFEDIEKRIYADRNIKVDLKNMYNNVIFFMALNLLEIIENSKFNQNNILSIYTNLYYVSKLEILLDYLTHSQLLELLDSSMKKRISKILKNDISNNIYIKIQKK